MKETRRKEATSENDIKIELYKNGREDVDLCRLTEDRIQ